MAGLAGLLSGAATDADFSRGLSQGFVAGAFLTVNITFLRQLCRPQGVGDGAFWLE